MKKKKNSRLSLFRFGTSISLRSTGVVTIICLTLVAVVFLICRTVESICAPTTPRFINFNSDKAALQIGSGIDNIATLETVTTQEEPDALELTIHEAEQIHETEQLYCVQVNTQLRLRKEASIWAEVIALLPNGCIVKSMGKITEYGWMAVHMEENGIPYNGYVYAEYLVPVPSMEGK